MAALDIDAALRWFRFDAQKTLARRDDADLPFVRDQALAGRALLLDTCVYIDQLQDRTPDILDRLIERRQVNHSMAAVQELMHTIGRLDPVDPRTAKAIAAISRPLRAMRPYRVFTPDPDTLGKAALLAGLLCRLQGYTADSRLQALQDCVLFLHAKKLGLALLTRNISDFDYLLQLLPQGRVLFYRQA